MEQKGGRLKSPLPDEGLTLASGQGFWSVKGALAPPVKAGHGEFSWCKG